MIDGGKKTYGNNSQVARNIKGGILNWYKDAILKKPSTDHIHYGKLNEINDIIKEEIRKEQRNDYPDLGDLGVEQLSLSDDNLKIIKSTIRTALKEITSVRIVADGAPVVPWAERESIEDGVFDLNVESTKWVSGEDKNNVSEQLESYYATYLSGSEKSFKEGLAEASGPERDFEKSALPSLIGLTGNRLAFYYKSPENKTDSFRIGVETDNKNELSPDKKKVSDFYPDYLGELRNEKGEHSPWIIEVKAEEDVNKADGDLNSILNAKVKSLIKISEDYNMKAGVAYAKNNPNNDSEWVIIIKVLDSGKFITANFKDYMLS